MGNKYKIEIRLINMADNKHVETTVMTVDAVNEALANGENSVKEAIETMIHNFETPE
jgi:hypothetical protein